MGNKKKLYSRIFLGSLMLLGAFLYSFVVDFENVTIDFYYQPFYVAIVGSILYGLPTILMVVFIGSIVRFLTKKFRWAVIVVSLVTYILALGQLEISRIGAWRVWLSAIITVGFSLYVIYYFIRGQKQE